MGEALPSLLSVTRVRKPSFETTQAFLIPDDFKLLNTLEGLRSHHRCYGADVTGRRYKESKFQVLEGKVGKDRRQLNRRTVVGKKAGRISRGN